MSDWKDTSLPVAERVEDLLSKLTLEEKVNQTLYTNTAIARLGIEDYNWWNECLHGVARAGVATMFPQAIGLAATFDEELMHKTAEVISDEARAKHHESHRRGDNGIYKGLTYWSPNINIFRDPRWGRGHETYGEDPYLTARMGVSFVKGLQGDDPKYLKLAATVKHYAVHSGPENDRHRFDARPTDKDLRETYLPAFKECIQEGKAYSIMGAYNRTNGEPCCASKTLLQDILRDEWGFDGVVVSDCGAIDDIHKFHKVTADSAESAAMAVKNGCDVNCGKTYAFLMDAVKRGLLTEADIDKAARHALTTKFKLGMFDPEEMVPYSRIPYEVVACDEHLALSKEVANRSLVLLKNNGLLPLNKEALKNIAVVGPNADSRRALMGNYHGDMSDSYTVYEGFRSLASKGTRVWLAPGCTLAGNVPEAFWGEQRDSRLAEAQAAAARSDVVVLCVGLDETLEGEESQFSPEGGDKSSLRLPEEQYLLFEALREVGKPIIVAVMAGSALDLRCFEEHAAAVVQCWYPGQMGGLAIAETLFGMNNPSGRLPLTFYASDEDLPAFADYSMKNRTYRYYEGTPLYPFGYGLSYTKYNYSNLKVSAGKVAAGDSVKVFATVTNAGTKDGIETVQLYLKDVKTSTDAPKWQLLGFRGVKLAAGESKQVEFEIPARRMAVITDEGKAVLEPGRFTVYMGGQQPDERSRELTGAEVLTAGFEVTGQELEMVY